MGDQEPGKGAEIVDIDTPLMDKHGPLPLIQWADSLPEPTKWLIKGALPTDCCAIVGAEQKTGKTWLALEFALALASGGTAFDKWEAAEPGKTLIYSPEGGYKAMKRRLWAMTWGKRLNPVDMGQQIQLLPGPIHIDNPVARARLKATIAEFQPHLLILDPLISIHSGEKDENKSEISPILEDIRSLIQHAPGMSVIVVHHFNKAAKTASSMLNQLRGSSALAAWLDCAVLLTKESDDPGATRNINIILRDEVSPDPVGFQLLRKDMPNVDGEDVPEGLWSMRLEPCDPFNTGGNAGSKSQIDRALLASILDAVEGADGLYASQVARDCDCNKMKAGRYLERLKEQGNIHKGFDRRWRVK